MQVVRCYWTKATETAAARATSSTLRHTRAQKHASPRIALIPSYIYLPSPSSPFSSLPTFLSPFYCLSAPIPPLLSCPMLSSPSSWRCFFGDYLWFYWLMGWNTPICLPLPIWGWPCFPARTNTQTHTQQEHVPRRAHKPSLIYIWMNTQTCSPHRDTRSTLSTLSSQR